MTALPARNMLGQETSPYLLQHKDNPVHWRPWGDAALAEAQALNRPIFLSSGYAACHWCHVMAHESFDDPAIAAQLNENFVCIKLDKEERPEIDMLYQTALQGMQTQGGWPLTMFLRPDGHAFAGGTYFPPAEGFGRPAFRTVLDDIIGIWRDRRDTVDDTAGKLNEALGRLWGGQDDPKAVNGGLVDQFPRRVVQRIDQFFGGFEGSPKFPQVQPLKQVWQAFLRSAAEPYARGVLISLDNMCQGGIYDHLGGGFSRYSTDERWLVPHFEKMLYDNAQLIELLTLVWQQFRSPLYAARVDETIDWVLREMVTREGAFAASLDADSEGVEGKFYSWTEPEIDEILGPNEAPFFKEAYGVIPGGNWEGKTILHRLNRMGFLRPDQESVLTRNRRMLLMARARRTRPALDDKVLADWNGLMIAALVKAGAAFKRAEWHFAAVRAFSTVVDKLADGNVLYHAWRESRGRAETTAEGYANMARAALLLYEVTSDAKYFDRAKGWVQRLDDKFRDPVKGGYYLSSSDAADVAIRIKTVADNATPNYNGVIAEVLARLVFMTGEQPYRDRANETVSAFGAEIERNPASAPTMLNAVEFIMSAVQIVIVGDDRTTETQALVRAVLDRSLPMHVMTLIRPGQRLHAGHPAHGKGLVDNKPTAYVCSGFECSAPITDPVQLHAGLMSQAFHNVAQANAQARAQMEATQAANSR